MFGLPLSAIVLLGFVLSNAISFGMGWHYMSKVCDGREASAKLEWKNKLDAEESRRKDVIESAHKSAQKDADQIRALGDYLNELLVLEMSHGPDNTNTNTNTNKDGKGATPARESVGGDSSGGCLPVFNVMQLNKIGTARRTPTRP
jgi:hypothetical protein